MSSESLNQAEADAADIWAERCISELAILVDGERKGREKRSSARRAASGVALIKPEFGSPVSCTLVDRSEGGARLKVLSVLGIPDEFVLSIGAERLRARVAWRSAGEIGVALTLE